MIPKCDVQYRKGDIGFKLTKVGVTGVRKPVRVKREGLVSDLNGALNCTIDVFVDLPATQKGSHLSRNVEVLREVVADSVAEPITGLEDLAADICKKLLVKHEYAVTANVRLSADYFLTNKTPNGRDTLEMYKLIARGSIARGSPVEKTIGVEVVGMTVCPCAQQTAKEILGIGDEYPLISHNQRNVCTLTLDMAEEVSVEADELIALVEKSFSSSTYELLKRDDEGAVVIGAHNNPKFVEDVVRTVLKNVTDKYPNIPDDVLVMVKSESQESIHKHNAYAERTATMGELREELVQ